MLTFERKGRQPCDRPADEHPPSTSKRGVRNSSGPRALTRHPGVTLGRIVRSDSTTRAPARPTRPPPRRPRRPLISQSPLAPPAPGATPTIPPDATGSIQPAGDREPRPAVAVGGTFPITLTDDEGTKVELTAEPHEDRVADPRRRPRSCSPSAWATGSSARSRTSASTRPRRPTIPGRREVRRGRRREDRQPRGGPRHRRRQQLQPARQDRPAARARRTRSRRVRARHRDRLRRHRAHRRRQSGRSAEAQGPDRVDAGRLRPGRRGDELPSRSRGSSTSSMRRARSTPPPTTRSSPR